MLISKEDKNKLFAQIKEIVEYRFIEYQPDSLIIKVKSINSEQLEKINYLLNATCTLLPEESKKGLQIKIEFFKKEIKSVSNQIRDIEYFIRCPNGR